MWVGFADLAAVGVFVCGLAVSGSDSCDLRRIFGNCQDQSQTDAKKARRFADFQNFFPDSFTDLVTNTDKKFFVENELAAPKANKYEMATTQKKNCVIVREQLAIYEQSFHMLQDCDLILFGSQQLNSLLILSLLYIENFILA